MSIATRWIEQVAGRERERAARLRILGIAGVAILFFGLYFLGLSRPALLDPDEPVYGQVGREMLATGNWLTPHRNGRLWFDKPPLFHWAVAAGQWLLGPTALACRLPSALGACLLALLVYGFARRAVSGRAGLYSAAAIATCLQTIILARAAVTDMLFVTGFAAACFAFYLWLAEAASPPALGGEAAARGPAPAADRSAVESAAPPPASSEPSAQRPAPSAVFPAAGGIALGLATLTKGPVAPALVGAILVLWLAWERRLGRLLSRGALIAAGACLLVAGPWYAAMFALYPREFTQGFLVANNLVRFASPEHPGLSTPVYYFLPVLLIGLFPWTPFLFAALRGAVRSAVGRFLLVWVAVVFGFFSLSQTKLVTYIYPLYPAAACLIGGFLSDAEARRRGEVSGAASEGAAMAMRRATWAVLALALALAGGVLFVAAQKYRAALPAAGLLSLLLALGAGIGFRVAAHRTRRGGEPAGSGPISAVGGAVAAYSGMMLLFAPLLFGAVGPVVEKRESTRSLAEWAGRNGNPPVLGFRVKSPSFEFYSGRALESEKRPDSLRRRVDADSRLFILTDKQWVSVADQALAPRRLQIVAREGRHLLARPVFTE